MTLAPVDAAVVHVATLAGLEHHLREFCLKNVVLGRPPASDVFGEDRERALDGGLDDDRGLRVSTLATT